MTTPADDEQHALQDEIAQLEKKLATARGKLPQNIPNGAPTTVSTLQSSSLHTLLLLADSALPLGSFAFSSGLESYLAHNKIKRGTNGIPQSQPALLTTFLGLSLQSLASTALPYVLAAYRNPSELEELDNDFDASTPCTVARRASVAQGKALLSVWERSFRNHYTEPIGTETSERVAKDAVENLRHFSTALRSHEPGILLPNGHLAPLWGVITLLLDIPLHSSAYLFLFSHARTVISAAVRASVVGPYQAQAVLASVDLREQVEALVQKYWNRTTEDAGQSVPVMDLWVGRHEKLYSRIFNS